MSNYTFSLALVLTSFNSEKYIFRSLSSAFFQIKPFNEIIIVDHGSTDNTVDIIQQFLATHTCSSSVRFFQLMRNFGGPAWSRNLGIKHVQSDYTCFLDADDLCSSDRCQIISDHLINKPDIVFHSCIQFYDLIHQPQIIKPTSFSKSYNNYANNVSSYSLSKDILLNGMITAVGSYSISTNILKSHNFLESREVIGAEDAILLLDILISSPIKALHIGKPLLYYYIGSFSSQSSVKPIRRTLTSPKNTIRNVNYILDHYSSSFDFIPYRLWFSLHFSYAKMCLFHKILLDILFEKSLKSLLYLCYCIRLVFTPYFYNVRLQSDFFHFMVMFRLNSL